MYCVLYTCNYQWPRRVEKLISFFKNFTLLIMMMTIVKVILKDGVLLLFSANDVDVTVFSL